jgi:hypothetical protein
VNYFPICGRWINDNTVLHAIQALKTPLSFVEIALIYSRKLMYMEGKFYRTSADPLDESLSFSSVTGLAALDLTSKYSMSKDKPA